MIFETSYQNLEKLILRSVSMLPNRSYMVQWYFLFFVFFIWKNFLYENCRTHPDLWNLKISCNFMLFRVVQCMLEKDVTKLYFDMKISNFSDWFCFAIFVKFKSFSAKTQNFKVVHWGLNLRTRNFENLMATFGWSIDKTSDKVSSALKKVLQLSPR